MSVHYQHTQPGTSMIVVLLVSALVPAAAAYTNTGSARWIGCGLALGLVIVSWLFSSLTVVVSDSELRWVLRAGLWNYRIALGDVESSRVVRNSCMNGFGIRMRPGGRLYNVAGLDAVELQLKSGEVRRIGTDDAARLAAALRRN
ncbi:MAG TPA: hypothetical protein VE396_10265 [Xanthobacteraceae bacterium]|nr:hypothetical protein [Xanthobacteraceae bacterium]